MVLKLFSCS